MPEAGSNRAIFSRRALVAVVAAIVVGAVAILVSTETGRSNLAHPSASTASSHVYIVSGGNLGEQSSVTTLIGIINKALSAAAKQHPSYSSQRRDANVGDANVGSLKLEGHLGSQTVYGPILSSTSTRCLAPALADIGSYAGSLRFVADLSWQSTSGIAYVMDYKPLPVPIRPRQDFSSTTSARHRVSNASEKVLMILDGSDCQLITVTFLH